MALAASGLRKQNKQTPIGGLSKGDRPAVQGAPSMMGGDLAGKDGLRDQQRQKIRMRPSFFVRNWSPLTRKIVAFNLIALNILVAGVLWLNASRGGLIDLSEIAVDREVSLVADLIELQFAGGGTAPDLAAIVGQTEMDPETSVTIFDRQGVVVVAQHGDASRSENQGADTSGANRSDPLSSLRNHVMAMIAGQDATQPQDDAARLQSLLVENDAETRVVYDKQGAAFYAIAPLIQDGVLQGHIGMVIPATDLEAVARAEMNRLLILIGIATIICVGVSVGLAGTIANPISEMADAAELGRDRNHRNKAPGRIRIPDLTGRTDEIGRLSGALRGMVGALYDRIDGNEQFAADVAHEIKNPLASLRSAVGSLRMVQKTEHRDRLLDVIEHDVFRLDRLVSDISNASRLDAELVKEDEVAFDLIEMVQNISQFSGEDALVKGVEFITDLPENPIHIHGLEQRLAQVFVNLVTNAISFCDEGDAIRVWVRKRENRVLVVVEDTGPGIPEDALQKIFNRFYTSRPKQDFGNNSGLGLAISKQIVEAHGGVIWAENIRPTEADPASDPLGARFVVGLPI